MTKNRTTLNGMRQIFQLFCRSESIKLKLKINLIDIAKGGIAGGLHDHPTKTQIINAAKAAFKEDCAFKYLSKTDYSGEWSANSSATVAECAPTTLKNKFRMCFR